jgi:hypothetical protein
MKVANFWDTVPCVLYRVYTINYTYQISAIYQVELFHVFVVFSFLYFHFAAEIIV